MDICKATVQDIETIMHLIRQGREKMVASGNLTQWTDGHPSREDICHDIAQGNSYLMLDKGQPVATFAFIQGPDPTYAAIYDGEWLNEEPYYVIHRVASSPEAHGVVKVMLDHCFTIARNIRIDTHADNVPMRRALEKQGFHYCGIIHLMGGDARVAYMKFRS